MQEIHLSDQLYAEVKVRALEAGFETVDDYVADVLVLDVCDQTEDLDHLFTPERLAHIERSAAQIKAGQFYTAEEVREHFDKKFSR
jgi:hypothetical protein